MQASLVSAALKFATEDPEQSGTRFAELSFLFEGELNPVNPKAQRKVPVPAGACAPHACTCRTCERTQTLTIAAGAQMRERGNGLRNRLERVDPRAGARDRAATLVGGRL